jgi:hypothetical protein
MTFRLRFPFAEDLHSIENTVRTTLQDVRQDLSARLDDLDLTLHRSDLATVFDGGVFRTLLAQSWLGNLDFSANIRNLNNIAAVVELLPGDFGKPDAIGEVPTGSADVGREQAAVAAGLAAVPRIVEALGPDAQTLAVRVQDFPEGERYESFAVSERYEDPASGLSAVRLTPLGGGAEVYAVDGTQSGSRADQVAGATLGRLQVESAAFTEMTQDAAQIGLEQGRPALFVGASLGGAVAQVAAYETAETLRDAQLGFDTGAVQLVTVDALGGRDAAEAINGGALDPAALALITALNLRTEGDFVSRIGSHIGATLTLPALDAQGNEVQLDAADAHVNVVSLLQNLGNDKLFAAGVLGAPAEVSGLAAASNAVADELIHLWLASGPHIEEPSGELQLPGTASFDARGMLWSLDADDNGTVDIAVHLSTPANPDFLLG